MKLHIFGAARTVTGSMFLLEYEGHKLLLDCGMFQGKRDETYQVNLNFPFKPEEIDAMILSHAHIDHSGNIPNLVRQGYKGWIYATNASVDLADIMLRDSGHIQESDVKYVNKKRRQKGLPAMEPLYTQRDAIEALPQFRSVWYKQAFEPIPGVTARLYDAGHILGSSAVALDYQENGRTKRFWFSGDIGRLDAPILQDPVMPENADTLLMECTYGDKKHERLEDAYDEFVDAINRTVRRGGKVIVPAFAVGRTQNLSYMLSEAIDNGDIADIPVVIDSLAVNASDLYRKHTECFDDETWQYIAEHRMQGLDFDNLIFTRSVDQIKALNEYKGPMVIISASGMAESGRIQHHLANNIEDGRNTILIISWQAPYTLGGAWRTRSAKYVFLGMSITAKQRSSRLAGSARTPGRICWCSTRWQARIR